MPNELPILNQVRIDAPCPASWDEMTGDSKSRHCEHCDKSVFFLSNMTAAEAARVVRENPNDLCARIAVRKSDGTLITQPERSLMQRVTRRLAVAVVVPVLLLLPGCSRDNLPPTLAAWFGPEEGDEFDETMGDIDFEGGYVVAMEDIPETPDAAPE